MAVVSDVMNQNAKQVLPVKLINVSVMEAVSDVLNLDAQKVQ